MQTSNCSIHAAALVVAVLLLCTTGAGVQAWGAKGHRIAGHMAHDLLTPETRAAIQQLMGSDDLATFSLYLDKRKNSRRGRFQECFPSAHRSSLALSPYRDFLTRPQLLTRFSPLPSSGEGHRADFQPHPVMTDGPSGDDPDAGSLRLDDE
jgi:hypothetical protein